MPTDTVTDTPETTDADVDIFWRRLCNEVLMELVQEKLEELRGRI